MELHTPSSSNDNAIAESMGPQTGYGQGNQTFNPLAGRRILIVDDDVELAEFLGGELKSTGFAVDIRHDGEQALAALQDERPYDLLILDLNLPKIDGISLLRQVKPMQPRLWMLVLTARSRTEDKVKALGSGADDCLTKPFSLAELTARIQALFRRDLGMIPNVSHVGDLTLHREERRVERNGRRIELTPREFSILELMMRNVGRPVSRATLLEQVWNMPPDPSTNIVDVYMKYVRDKVDLPGERKLTHTIRGVGYELRDVKPGAGRSDMPGSTRCGASPVSGQHVGGAARDGTATHHSSNGGGSLCRAWR
jgi:DNA-binding response OmpR family regulator